MLKYGYITELDTAKGMVRVNFTEDGIVSNLLPVSVPASKADKYSFPFAINEQVWCLMDENCEFGIVGGAIYSDKDKPPSEADAQTILIDINASKLQLKVDRQSGNLNVESAGKIQLKNSTVSLIDLFQELKDIITNLKVNTPAGPSVGLLPDTVTALTDFETKYNQLLM